MSASYRVAGACKQERPRALTRGQVALTDSGGAALQNASLSAGMIQADGGRDHDHHSERDPHPCRPGRTQSWRKRNGGWCKSACSRWHAGSPDRMGSAWGVPRRRSERHDPSPTPRRPVPTGQALRQTARRAARVAKAQGSAIGNARQRMARALQSLGQSRGWIARGSPARRASQYIGRP